MKLKLFPLEQQLWSLQCIFPCLFQEQPNDPLLYAQELIYGPCPFSILQLNTANQNGKIIVALNFEHFHNKRFTFEGWMPTGAFVPLVFSRWIRSM